MLGLFYFPLTARVQCMEYDVRIVVVKILRTLEERIMFPRVRQKIAGPLSVTLEKWKTWKWYSKAIRFPPGGCRTPELSETRT